MAEQKFDNKHDGGKKIVRDDDDDDDAESAKSEL